MHLHKNYDYLKTFKFQYMKQLILSAAMLVFFGVTASAQTSTGGSGSRTTGAVSSTGSTTGAQKGTKSKKGTTKTANLNQRREYKSKNGQTATPTGHEATGVGATNAAVRKDTATNKTGNQQ